MNPVVSGKANNNPKSYQNIQLLNTPLNTLTSKTSNFGKTYLPNLSASSTGSSHVSVLLIQFRSFADIYLNFKMQFLMILILVNFFSCSSLMNSTIYSINSRSTKAKLRNPMHLRIIICQPLIKTDLRLTNEFVDSIHN